MLSSVVDTVLDRTIVLGYGHPGLQIRRRLPGWPADPPRMDGQVVLVTGASSGLGRASCAGFARLGASVRALARDQAKADRVAAELRAETGGDIRGVACDVSEAGGIRRFADAFAAEEDRLDVLVCNAGVMPAERTTTSEGVELTFATHVLGPYVLVDALGELLRATAPSRVITVSSGGMYSQGLAIDDLQSQAGEYRPTQVYAKTKRAQVLLTEELAVRLRGSGVVIHAMHPGWASTPGVEQSLPGFHRVVRAIIRDADQGADTIVWLGGAPEPLRSSGGFWHDRRPRPTHLVPMTRESDGDRQRLWDAVQALAAQVTGDPHPAPGGSGTP